MRPFNRITWSDSFTYVLKVDRMIGSFSYIKREHSLSLCHQKETHKTIVSKEAASIIFRNNYACHQLLSELPQQEI